MIWVKCFILVRHGSYDPQDSQQKLTPEGEKESIWTANQIFSIGHAQHICKILVSPQLRARWTAKIIVRKLSSLLPSIKLDPFFREISALDALTPGEKNLALPKAKEAMATRPGLPLEEALYLPEVGFLSNLKQRGKVGYEALEQALKEIADWEAILVVTHGGSVIEPIAHAALEKISGGKIDISGVPGRLGGITKCGEFLIINYNDQGQPVNVSPYRRYE